MAATSAPVRISTPASRAAAASAVGERARAAAREDRLAGRAAVVAGRIGEQHGGRARRPRPHRGVLDAAPRDRRLERVGLERFGHEVGDRHRQDAGDRPAVVAAEAAERPPELEPGERVAETRATRCRAASGRRSRRGSPTASGRAGRTPAYALGVARPTAPAGPRRSGPTSPHSTIRVAVEARREGAHLRADERQPVALEVEVADDRRPQPPDGVGERRHAGARRQLGRLGRAADASSRRSRTTVRSPAFAEVGGGDQAVVAAADDDRVVAVRRRAVATAQAAFRPRARRTSSAAIRPLAPMIPPPGWVDEPHSHRSRTGVRKRA